MCSAESLGEAVADGALDQDRGERADRGVAKAVGVAVDRPADALGALGIVGRSGRPGSA